LLGRLLREIFATSIACPPARAREAEGQPEDFDMNDDAHGPLAIIAAWAAVYGTASARRTDAVAVFKELSKHLPGLAQSDLLAGADAARAVVTELRSLQHRLSEIERRSGKR
jgi:hypothetical protein